MLTNADFWLHSHSSVFSVIFNPLAA